MADALGVRREARPRGGMPAAGRVACGVGRGPAVHPAPAEADDMTRKRKIAPAGGLQSIPGAIMLSAPNNSRGQATGNGLPFRAANQKRHVRLATCGNAKRRAALENCVIMILFMIGTNIPIWPAWSRVSCGTSVGYGESHHGFVDPYREVWAYTAGPESQAQSLIGGRRPAARRRDTRPERPRGPPMESDLISRPGVSVMRRAVWLCKRRTSDRPRTAPLPYVSNKCSCVGMGCTSPNAPIRAVKIKTQKSSGTGKTHPKE